MSESPATPNKLTQEGAKRYAKTAVPSLEKLTSVSRAKPPSLYEPSPASTYGGTAAGDSVPATPVEALSHDPTVALIHSLRAAQIDESFEQISGSPRATRDGKCYSQSEQRADNPRGSIVIEVYSSPAKSSISDALQKASANSSPNASRYKRIVESPSWRRGDHFVRQSGNESEDPFITGINVGHSSSNGSGTTFRPREDRVGLQLSPDTAQAILPPNACVFVANLSQTKTDEQLEYSVSSVFQAFGNVYVKIRRDSKGMPFAFCQYENVADAQQAILLGRGMPIDGRACRTEVAKVNRSLYLSRVTGGPITESEARQVLSRFGALEKVWYCSQTDKEMFRLPEGVWVMFAFFQDCRDAQAGFRDNPTYRLEQPRMPEDIRARLGSRPFQSPISPVVRASPSHGISSPQSVIRRAADLCSIFVGNLPANADENSLRDAFSVHGHIHQIELVRKPSVNANGVNAFAFIEYFSQDEAANAARGNYTLFGARLRVERKETIDPASRRDGSMLAGGSPRNRYFTDNEAMALMFQRGVSIGMANAAAASVAPPAPALQPPAYGPYPYYPQPAYGGPYIGPAIGVENEAAPAVQLHGSPYMPPNLSQYQYPQVVPSYAHFPHIPARPNTYQWPPSNVVGEGNGASSGTTIEESR